MTLLLVDNGQEEEEEEKEETLSLVGRMSVFSVVKILFEDDEV